MLIIANLFFDTNDSRNNLNKNPKTKVNEIQLYFYTFLFYRTSIFLLKYLTPNPLIKNKAREL